MAAAVFEAIQLTAEQIEEAYSDVTLTSLDASTVPGNEPEPAPEPEPEPEEEEVVEEEQPPAEEVPAIPETPAEPVAEEEEPAPAEPGPFDAAFDKLREILGMEIGTMTIDGTTYSKAILQPEFSLGRLKMALYLPIIYESNMFKPSDWYHPEGNDEWSFGTDYDWKPTPGEAFRTLPVTSFSRSNTSSGANSATSSSSRWAISTNMTIGHGLLMYNYANDADFPTVRRVGLNMGTLGGQGRHRSGGQRPGRAGDHGRKVFPQALLPL